MFLGPVKIGLWGSALPANWLDIGKKLDRKLQGSQKFPILAASPWLTSPWAGIYYGSN